MVCFAFDSISARIVVEGRYEASLLNFLQQNLFPKLAERGLCLDIGANIGNHSLCFAENFENVYSNEPNLKTFQLLQINACLVGNITPINVGLSNQSQRMTAYVWPSNMGGATVEPSQAERSAARGRYELHEFELVTLDSVLNDKDKGRVGFIKIDVERHEYKVLQGARNTIEASKPVIAFELLKSGIKDGKSDVVELLKSFGYQCFCDIKSTVMGSVDFFRLSQNVLPDFLHDKLKRVIVHETKALRKTNYPLILASREKLFG